MQAFIRWHSYAVRGDQRLLVGSGDLPPTVDGRLAMKKAEGGYREAMRDEGVDEETIAGTTFEHLIAQTE